jgi:hypothetical protein
MIADRVDLHAKIDALLKGFHQHNAGLRLKPTLRNSWGELHVDIEAYFSQTSGTCDMGDARMAIEFLRNHVRILLVHFAKKYPQPILALTFDYIEGEAQATVNLNF